jgi:hypothetical protein
VFDYNYFYKVIIVLFFMVRRCGESCECYVKLEKRNSIGDGTCSYENRDCFVRTGNKCRF